MARLEDRVTALEERQNMEVRLNASRDRDLSNLIVKVDSHTRMLQAVQERQAEHSQRLGSLEQGLESLRRITTDGFATLGGQLQLLLDRDTRTHD